MSDEIKNQLKTEDVNICEIIENETKEETKEEKQTQEISENSEICNFQIQEENNIVENSEISGEITGQIAVNDSEVDEQAAVNDSEIVESSEPEENELPDDCVEIVCPECNETVIIDSSNICPNCGCEFEEIVKKYRLSKLGIFAGTLSSAIYFLVIILLRFIKTPEKIKSDSLFKMDAFRNTPTSVFVGILALTVLIIILFIIFDIIINTETVYSFLINISVATVILLLSSVSIYLFLYSEGDKLFYILSKCILIFPVMEFIGGLLCFIDLFIKPKSKLNK